MWRLVRHFSLLLLVTAIVQYSGSACSSEFFLLHPVSHFDPDRSGEPPWAIVSLRPNLTAIIDRVGREIVWVKDDGSAYEGAIQRLPDGFQLGHAVTTSQAVTIFDAEGRSKLVWKRSRTPGNASHIPGLKLIPVSRHDPALWDFPFIRLSHVAAKILVPAARRKLQLLLRTAGRGDLANASVLATSKNGTYVLVREIEVNDGHESPLKKGQIIARVIVYRYNARGLIMHYAEIPLDLMAKVPLGDYATITPDGRLLVLIPQDDRIAISELPFTDIDERREEPEARIMLSGGGSTKPSSKATGVANHNEPLTSLKLAESSQQRQSIKEMRRIAKAYANLTWTASDSNLGIGVAAFASGCDNGNGNKNGRIWMRPHHLTNILSSPVREGKARLIRGVPYKWGGKDDVDTIQRALASGTVAGNICTCSYMCIRYDTTGIDCSGLIARIWGINEPLNTGQLLRLTTPLSSLRHLRYGDAFILLSNGHTHARMFTGRNGRMAGRFKIPVIESSTACGGVCERSYEVEYFHRYKISRRP